MGHVFSSYCPVSYRAGWLEQVRGPERAIWKVSGAQPGAPERPTKQKPYRFVHAQRCNKAMARVNRAVRRSLARVGRRGVEAKTRMALHLGEPNYLRNSSSRTSPGDACVPSGVSLNSNFIRDSFSLCCCKSAAALRVHLIYPVIDARGEAIWFGRRFPPIRGYCKVYTLETDGSRAASGWIVRSWDRFCRSPRLLDVSGKVR